jgi:hypothetical protein
MIEKRNSLLIQLLLLVVLTLSFISCKQEEKTVKDVMDRKISFIYRSTSKKEMLNLDYDKAFSFFSVNEKEILATKHWMFDVNVPVVVSVMCSSKHKIEPFWLKEKGFVKTGMSMKNEQTTYEVWQKSFNTGTVGLGINGLDNYSLHYFVSVAPAASNQQLVLSNFFPANQFVGTLDNGAFTYHDWDELVLSDVPEAMKGQKLLTTFRGRADNANMEF